MTDLPTPHAILFDLDGTLVDTVGTRVAAWRDVFAEEGLESDPAFVGTLMGSDGKLVAKRIAAAAGIELDEGRAADIDDRAGARFSELNTEPTPLPGVRTIVDHLESRGIPWAVATSSKPGQVQTSIDALGLDVEPTVTDGGNVEHAKPEPDLLLDAASQLGVEPAGFWYVGDSRWDMEAAVAAGMTAIGVTSGATPESDLREAGADLVVERLDELVTHVDAAS